MHRILLAAVVILTTAMPGTGRAAVPEEPTLPLTALVQFCTQHPTVDDPQRAGAPAGRPSTFLDMNVTAWRCLDGNVLICSDSADGD